MEFPGIGAHCSVTDCFQLDFLPIKCDACKSKFCNDHFLHDAHSCPIKHTKDGGTISGREKALGTTKNRCSVNKCKLTEFIEVVCGRCHQNYCLKHRHPSDHQCQETTVSSSPLAKAGPLYSTSDARQDSGSLPEEGPRSQKDSLTPRLEAGTAAKEEKDEGGNCHQGPPSKTRRRVKCGKCPACIASDCGNCRACQDKPKFGGPNKIKQACYQRKCQNMTYGKREINENKSLEPNRNFQPKPKSRDDVFKVPPVPRATQSQCKPKPMSKKAFEEARRLREMEPVGVMTWDQRDLRRVHNPGGLLVSESTLAYYEHQCTLCKRKFRTIRGLLNHDFEEHVNGGFSWHVCITCVQDFKTEEELDYHRRILRCDVCGITYTCQNGFKYHKKKRDCLAAGDSFHGFDEVNPEDHVMYLEKQARFLHIDEDKAESSGIPGFPGFWNVEPARFWNVESDGDGGRRPTETSIVCPLGHCDNPFNCLLDSGFRAKD